MAQGNVVVVQYQCEEENEKRRNQVSNIGMVSLLRKKQERHRKWVCMPW